MSGVSPSGPHFTRASFLSDSRRNPLIVDSALVTFAPSSKPSRFAREVSSGEEKGRRSTFQRIERLRPSGFQVGSVPTSSDVLALKLSVMTPPRKSEN